MTHHLRDTAVTCDRTLREAIGDGEAGVDSFFGTLHRLAGSVPGGGRDIVPEGWPGNRRS